MNLSKLKMLCVSLVLTASYVLAGTMDAELIGPDGEVIIFYKDGNSIVVKECKNYAILSNRNDCVQKPGTSTVRIPVTKFKNRLKAVLKLPAGNYTPEMRRKIELYKKGQLDDIAELERQRSEVKTAIDRIQAFIDRYGQENANLTEKDRLKNQLAAIEQQLADNSDLAIREINRLVENLVNNIIGGTALTKFVFSQNRTGFEFNILKSYLEFSGISATFVDIKAGTFEMGSPSDEVDRDSDETQHRVTLTKDFQMQTTEVTQMQWVNNMGHNPSRFKTKEDCPDEYMLHDEKIPMCPNHPVERVSWNDVQEFISKLNQGNDRYTYRLPTEAEWEFAARAGTTTAFNLGDNISPEQVNYDGNYPYRNAAKGVYRRQTVSVASLPNANNFGLYDMHGNVWEWVQDKYGRYPTSHVTDPKGASAGSNRVLRGGSWYGYARNVRSALRDYMRAGSSDGIVGFRLLRMPK